MTELVCPEFYVEEWEREGRKRRGDHKQFPNAADDGICCLEEYDEHEKLFTCRCGQIFLAEEAIRLTIR